MVGGGGGGRGERIASLISDIMHVIFTHVHTIIYRIINMSFNVKIMA